ncbi:MAG TPA: D-2-hydroxyacid dehydrogenase [Burkholderiales bacterium]|nr:D-2-hydroxyacid dehydrogenase [Burkholderiales bacterium]
MTALLVSHRFNARYGARAAAAAEREGAALEFLVLPPDPAARLPEAECARAEIAFFSGDVFPDHSRQFFSAVRKAPRLAWLHVFNVGVDHPIYAEMLARGVRLTTSAGATAVPVAHTAIMGLLALARGFPHWLEAQSRRSWEPVREEERVPRDLRGQTALILGLGHIGREIARLARALGLYVIGVRRRPRAPEDPVDELHPPRALAELAPRADWLIVACPLTEETRGLVNAPLIARLPRGARVINVARGGIVEEAALVAALESGQLAGAYLDVFEREPLPPDSPLWGLPNVLITPHDAGAAAGNEERLAALFLENLGRYLRGEPLRNEVRAQGAGTG